MEAVGCRTVALSCQSKCQFCRLTVFENFSTFPLQQPQPHGASSLQPKDLRSADRKPRRQPRAFDSLTATGERTLAGILCGWQRNDSHQARKVQNNTYIPLAFTTAIFFFIRRMYPYVVVTPNGLKPGMQYVVVLRIVPVDNKRYKYTNGLWHAVGGSDAIVDSSRMSFKHPTTPALGEHLNGKPLIFKHAKLTHIRDNKEHVCLYNCLLHILLSLFFRYWCMPCTSTWQSLMSRR